MLAITEGVSWPVGFRFPFVGVWCRRTVFSQGNLSTTEAWELFHQAPHERLDLRPSTCGARDRPAVLGGHGRTVMSGGVSQPSSLPMSGIQASRPGAFCGLSWVLLRPRLTTSLGRASCVTWRGTAVVPPVARTGVMSAEASSSFVLR